MRTFLDRIPTEHGAEWVRRAIWTVFVLSLLGLVVRGGSSPADPYLDTTGRIPLADLEEIAFEVTSPTGAVAVWCAMLAESEEQRQTGLMNQRDLRGYDAMVFRYPAPANGAFHMKSTLIPLAVAFFGADGGFLGAHGMDPCPPDTIDCPSYPSPAPFLHALEVPRGGLGRLGIGPGATLSFPDAPCPS